MESGDNTNVNNNNHNRNQEEVEVEVEVEVEDKDEDKLGVEEHSSPPTTNFSSHVNDANDADYNNNNDNVHTVDTNILDNPNRIILIYGLEF